MVDIDFSVRHIAPRAIHEPIYQVTDFMVGAIFEQGLYTVFYSTVCFNKIDDRYIFPGLDGNQKIQNHCICTD